MRSPLRMDTDPPSIKLNRPYDLPGAREVPDREGGAALRLLAALAGVRAQRILTSTAAEVVGHSTAE